VLSPGPCRASENVSIEEFTPESAVQPFDIRVLRRFAGLDKGEGDLPVFAPSVKALADEFQAIVHPDHRREAPAFFELLKRADDAASR